MFIYLFIYCNDKILRTLAKNVHQHGQVRQQDERFHICLAHLRRVCDGMFRDASVSFHCCCGLRLITGSFTEAAAAAYGNHRQTEDFESSSSSSSASGLKSLSTHDELLPTYNSRKYTLDNTLRFPHSRKNRLSPVGGDRGRGGGISGSS